MCILFVYIGDGKSGKYKAIIASNRDEYLNRPTESARRWPTDRSVIGGQDLKEGLVGGTWLAICGKRKKLGALLNLPMLTSKNAKSRGFLVTDFVSGDIKSKDYIEPIQEHHKNYNPFNLVTVEMEDDGSSIYHYSSVSNDLHIFLDSGCYSFSNCTIEKPYQKTIKGKEKFEQIIEKHSDDKDKLIEGILSLLKWDKLHLPDPVIEENKLITTKVASVCVDFLPDNTYGTRTHTIILVDIDNNIEYIEWTKVHDTEWTKTVLLDRLG